MTDAIFPIAGSHGVSVLLHPSIVPVLDVFRSLGSLDDQYDLAVLDGPEQALLAFTRPETAKGIVSDALLLAFALTRQRGRSFEHRPIGSRHGSIDEYCLMGLIGSVRDPASAVTLEAASALGIVSMDFMVSLARELVQQIDLGSITCIAPSLPEFRAVLNRESDGRASSVEVSRNASFHFKQ